MVYKYEKLGEELIKILKQRKKNGKYVSEHLDEPIDLDIS